MGKQDLAKIDWDVRQLMADHLAKVEGRLKTFMEAITEDSVGCEARKSLVASMIWDGSGSVFERMSDLVLGKEKE